MAAEHDDDWTATAAAARIAAPLEPPAEPPIRIKTWLAAAMNRILRPVLRRQRSIDEDLLAGIRHAQQIAEAAQRHLDQLEQRFTLHEQRHSARPFMTEPWSEWEDPRAGHVEGFQTAGRVAGEDSYTSFEHRFRGTRERIIELQRPYIEMLRSHEPVLDCGCGRGELLELLADAGIEASGVDMDAGMLNDARQRGLDVSEGDAIATMDRLPGGTLGAVVAMQVIEHLPEPQLIAFFRAARKALRPGGRLIVETVNPYVIEALNAFWLDPTHQHPLFPDVVLELCRAAGFDTGFVMHPNGAGDVRLDRTACPAYAVVADVASGPA